MGLFRSNDTDDDGCGAHHFPDEFREEWNDWKRDTGLMVTPRGEEHIPVVILRVDKKRTCLHEGCSEAETGMERHYAVPRRAMIRGGNNGYTDPPESRRRAYADRLRDVADQIDPDADWEADDDEE